ncbi:hypothetical protein TWF679_004209 [Orbilia oligospora]|uniref:Nucleoside phosphorylase domain-containing protein n=1 Tax=Orbilia oligospora TaxID=2813651 RepID=A0A8H8VM95_ORBOL|nr:hypothetical protein TWF679_004209 [Orbilia oligospora]
MAAVEDEGPIYKSACECRDLFELRTPDNPPSTIDIVISDYEQKFLAWSAYMGVFAQQPMSLDHRLRERSDICDLVLRRLDVLEDALRHLIIVSCQPPKRLGSPMYLDGRDGDEESISKDLELNEKNINDYGDCGYDPNIDPTNDISEMDDLIEDIETSLTQLSQLGTMIRKYSSTSRATRISQFAKNQQSNLGTFEKLARIAVNTLYPDANDNLRAQLTQSMVETCASILYKRSHQNRMNTPRLSQESTIPKIPPEFEMEIVDPTAPNIKSLNRGMPSPFRPLFSLGTSASQNKPYPMTVSAASILDTIPSKRLHSLLKRGYQETSSYRASSVQLGRMKYPPPSGGQDLTEYRTCEWCLERHPDDLFADKRRWSIEEAFGQKEENGQPSHEIRRQGLRQKTGHYDLEDRVYESGKDLSAVERDRYTVAWVCALYTELAAAQAMLDEIHDAVATDPNDSNTYILGSIGRHNVVVACLPDAQYGTNNAANVLTNLIRTFKSIRLGLMVGIGGGVPSTADIRLGDIVVGTRVMQYDLGKIGEDGEIQRTAIPKIPHSSAGTVISALRAKHNLGQSCIPFILRERLGGHPNYGRPDLPDHQGSSHDRRQEVLDSLKYDEINSRKTDIRSAHEKTCRWFLKHPDYKDWLDPARLSDHCGFLWIRGKPGAGKSTIMKFIYGETRKAARNVVVASFFFHTRGGILEKSISGMYRSLLLQLLEGYPDLQTVLDDTDLIPKNQNGCPPLNVLKDLFTNAVSSLGERPFTCFIDALDECDEQEVRTMVQDIEDLAERSTTMGTPLRICFSSRHYPCIDIHRGIKLTLESQPGHSQDLESYVISRLRMGKGMMAEELRTQILQKAAGSFLWVVLVVHILNEENSRGQFTIQKRLPELPIDLSALFKDMLKRDNEDMEGLLLCIIWILYARRTLSPSEYYHALWSGLSLKNLVDEDIPVVTVPDARDFISNCVTSSSKGLAEITKSNRPTVQFIHESVRDFLIKDRGLQELWPDHGVDLESLSHERLKECCNVYMSHLSTVEAVRREIGRENATQRTEISINYPFLEYASQNILFHANSAARAVPQDNFLLAFNSTDWIDILNIFEKFRARRYKRSTGLLYILAEKNLANLIRMHPDRYFCFKVESERYGPPLLAALALGSHEAVQVLLEAQAQLSSGSELYELCQRYSQPNYERITLGRSFEFSKRKGVFAHLLEIGDEILPLFLIYSVPKSGPDPDNRLGPSPLLHAVSKGNEAIVRALLERNVDVDSMDDHTRTPLFYAVEAGHELVVRLLLEKGANINHVAQMTGTALHHAINSKQEQMVRLLLENKIDTSIRDMSGRTALYEAASLGDEVIFKLVLDKSSDKDPREYDGSTPLSLAAREGHLKVFQQLLATGQVDADRKDNNGETPLFKAAEGGHQEIVKDLLLINYVNPDSRNERGVTPLATACSSNSNNTSVVQLLLATKRVDPDSQDNFQNTPLLNASRRGREAIVQQLLATGRVNTNPKDWDGNTPLMLAVIGGHPKVVEQLLATSSVNADSQNNNSQTPLLLAVMHRNETIVRQLLAIEQDGESPTATVILQLLRDYHRDKYSL